MKGFRATGHPSLADEDHRTICPAFLQDCRAAKRDFGALPRGNFHEICEMYFHRGGKLRAKA
jgi:hypothetical protein